MGIKNHGPSKRSKHLQGHFPISETKKYFGPEPIIFRSSWEYRFIVYCERNESVVRWSSEPVGIPYYMPGAGKSAKQHIYYPDFFVEMNTGDKLVIEIKPSKYTKKPRRPSRNSKAKSYKRYREDLKAYYVNYRKWEAARKYCKRYGWKFRVLTENFFSQIGL